MMNLSREITSKLPDWMNPIFVKEFRQTLHSKMFWVTSLIIVLLEIPIWHIVKDQNLAALYDSLQMVLSWLWLVGIICIMQPMISRWVTERGLDAVSPERTTTLSAWRILNGKICNSIFIILWVTLLVSPLVTGLLIKINSNLALASDVLLRVFLGNSAIVFTRGVLLSAVVLFVMILNVQTWTTLVVLARYGRNTRRGIGAYGWVALVLGTLVLIFCQVSTRALFTNTAPLIPFAVVLFLTMIPLVYGLLLLVSLLKPEQSNQMFTARLGGYILLLVTVGFSSLFYLKGWIIDNDALTLTLFVCGAYISFQSLLAAMEPLYMPRRMFLDAPANPVGKAIWFACGTGSVCAWIHLLIPFAVINILFFSMETNVSLMIALSWICYMVIYGAITALIRLYKPNWNGAVIFLTLSVCACIFDFFFVGSGSCASPLGFNVNFFLMLLASLFTLGSIELNSVMFSYVTLLILVAWCAILLMLLASFLRHQNAKRR